MPQAAEPPVRSVGRYELDAAARQALPWRQGAWTTTQAATATTLAILGLQSSRPDLALGIALALGLFAAFPKQIVAAPLTGLVVIALTLVAGLGAGGTTIDALLGMPSSMAQVGGDLAGRQVLAAGAAAGVASTWLSGGPMRLPRAIQGALAGAALLGLGTFVASALVPSGLPIWLGFGLSAALVGLITSQLTLVGALRYRPSTRIPKASKIKAVLLERYHPPCMDALRIDGELARAAPDPEARDGLGEVAAWVFKLQWTLQTLDRELEAVDPLALQTQMARHTADADAAEDPFTRDQLLATARHLDGLMDHRRALEVERGRTEAMRHYASAFLQEARAGLALARVQPGGHTPSRLNDVLHRLRNHAADRAAERATAREVASLA